jgi:glycopeptide antibiotics resistance protein
LKEQLHVFREVPVLPVVVPLAAAVFVLLLGRWHQQGRLSAARAAIALVGCVYGAGIVANTVFPIYLDKPVGNAAWDSSLNLVPLAGYEASDAIMNIVVFAPLGIVVALLVAEASWWRVLGVAATLSLTIEATQLVTAHLLGAGHVADINDLTFNVVGAAIGFGCYRALRRPISQLAHHDAPAQRWPSGGARS